MKKTADNGIEVDRSNSLTSRAGSCWRHFSRVMGALIALASIPALAAGPPSGPHPRFLLGTVKANLAADYSKQRPQITKLIRTCDGQAGTTIASGYQGWDWVDQMAACAVAWTATGNAAEAAQAVKYWQALLDDRDTVGDHMGGVGDQGGTFVVCVDSGYSMRTHGTYGALGLDWLYNAPGVNASLRAHAVSRVDAWGNWYQNGDARCVNQPAGGYLNNVPASNYFAGYFLATWAAAIAVGTDDAVVGPRLWTRATTTLTDGIMKPGLAGELRGGDQFEGWQYGELTVGSIALASAAAAENGYGGFANQYLHDTIGLHLYALHAGNQGFFDSGDHGSRPVLPGSAALWGALIAVPGDSYAPFARHYLDTVTPGSGDWTSAIAEATAPWTTADWTTAGLPLSWYAPGTGTVLARSGWGSSDVWSSVQSAGRAAPDHQHCDAGHFELARGGDDLVIATPDYGNFATWNNNTMLFDDGGANLAYPPNQAPWGPVGQVVITHYAELGAAAVAQADFAKAYNNQGGGNSVTLARREWVFFRPDLVIINDRDRFVSPSVKATFPLHTAPAPLVNGATLTADVGGSRLTSRTLLPQSPARAVITEAVANAGSAPWHDNTTWASPLYRAEESTSGSTSAVFLHAIIAGANGVQAANASVVSSGGANVVRVDGNPSRIVVLPAATDGSDLALPLTYDVPAGITRHVVFGLAAAASYRMSVVAAGGGCQVTIEAGTDANVTSGDRAASFTVNGCDGGSPPPADMALARTPADLAPPQADPSVQHDLALPAAADLAQPPTSDLGATRDLALAQNPDPSSDLSPPNDLGTSPVDLARTPQVSDPSHGAAARARDASSSDGGETIVVNPGCSVGGRASNGSSGTALALIFAALIEWSRRRRAR